MKVLMYEPTGGFWPYTPELTQHIADCNINTFLLTADQKKNYSLANVVYLPVAKNMNKLPRRYFPIWLVNRFLVCYQWIKVRNKIIQDYKPDILHVQSTAAVIDQYYFKGLKRKLKIVMTVHDVLPITNSWASISKGSLKKIYSLADKIIVHSEVNKSELINLFGINSGQICVIPHGVSLAKDAMSKDIARKSLNLASDYRYILLFGDLRKSKGLALALQSFGKLQKTNDKVKLIIAGSPATDINLALLFQLAQKLNIGPRVIWETQYIKENEISKYFCASDIVILPYTQFHSQSGVLLQAYKYNRPVIVTNVGSLGQTVLRDNTGIVVNDFKPESLAAGMRQMLDSSDLYAKCQKQQDKLVKGDYNWQKVARKTLNVYRTVCP